MSMHTKSRRRLLAVANCVATVIGLMVLASAVVITQPASRTNRGGGPSAPTPRWPDGRVNFGPPPGGKGHWNSGPHNLSEGVIKTDDTGNFMTDLSEVDKVAPFQPWSRALFLYRQTTHAVDDPHFRCRGPAGPRQFSTPYGLEIIDQPELKRLLILSAGGGHAWRVVYMDGRSHPAPDDLEPTYFGHGVGHWEGDTVVIDTVGFNERFWMATNPRGVVHTDRLHLIEKLSRPDFNTLKYEVTIDDPGAYTRPWTSLPFLIPWNPSESKEFFCTDNNLYGEEYNAAATPIH
jgi:hypothetical protein